MGGAGYLELNVLKVNGDKDTDSQVRYTDEAQVQVVWPSTQNEVHKFITGLKLYHCDEW